MKHIAYALCLLSLVLATASRAQDRGFGIGVIIGDPTGISAKLWTSQSNAAQFALAWRSADPFLGTRVSFSGDYLWHSFDVIRATERFPVYYGVGGVIASGGRYDAALGFRGVFGIDWLSMHAPIDVFLQVVPVLVLAPSTDFEIGAGIGIRFFFR
ncbi:MAG TPA: hypothetical protein VI758_02145 [Bacteroidota bacterium]